MTPKEALQNLDQAASTASLTRQQHVAVQESVSTLQDYIRLSDAREQAAIEKSRADKDEASLPKQTETPEASTL